MAAAKNGDRTLVNLLLESGANPALTDNHGQTVLHYCASSIPAAQIEARMAAAKKG